MGRPSTSQSPSIFVLYRFYGTDDALLYVGLTRDPSRRLARHAGDKSWWTDVARVEFSHFGSLQELRDAEREAITTEKPLHNIHMNGSYSMRKQSPKDAAEEAQIDGLVGRFFHSFRDASEDPEDDKYATFMFGRVLQWQGHVVEQITDDLYAIETFSWWDGFPSGDRHLVRIDDMLQWRFYDSSFEMQAALPCGEHYDSGNICQGEREFYYQSSILGFHFVCNGCRKRYPGFADYAEIVWRDGRAHPK